MTKHTACIITFKKSNGDIIVRPRLSCHDLNIGDETSMGWTVLDIHYQFNDGNYYHEEDYLRKLRESRETIKQRIAGYVIKKAYSWR